jgi:hypothetical protein
MITRTSGMNRSLSGSHDGPAAALSPPGCEFSVGQLVTAMWNDTWLDAKIRYIQCSGGDEEWLFEVSVPTCSEGECTPSAAHVLSVYNYRPLSPLCLCFYPNPKA